MRKSYVLSLLLVLVLTITVEAKGQTRCPPELSGKRVALIIGSGSEEAKTELIKDVGTVLETHLLNCGFQIIDQATVEKIIPEQEKQLILRGDTVGAVKISEKLGADLWLTGQFSVKTRPIEGYQTNLKSIYVTLSLKLISAKTGQAVSSKTWTGKTAGSEISKATLGIVEKNAEGLVRGIYEEYCQRGSAVVGSEASPSSEVLRRTGEHEERAISTEETQQQIRPKSETTPKSSSSLEDL